MTLLDYAVLITYFIIMAGIGLWSMLKIKKQEDFFLGGRAFGKVLQAFAAFGAGTGSYDPVTVGRTTFTSGLSGIWSVMLWLFVTPFYWITGVWYRRMRHLTLGDWFVERYQSRALGLAYALFGVALMMSYLGLGFSAVGKVCAPLIGQKTFDLPQFGSLGGTVGIEFVLVPVIALVVLIYGILGGLRAAYWTDLVQGIFIILLSVLLIPAGLSALVQRYGNPDTMSIADGFQVMHQQVPGEFFQLVGTPRSSDFPIQYIVAICLLNLVGIVVQPHFIATGGGSAKSETSARVGLVVGNFMKRLCTIGWALTALIVLAYMADNVELAEDPDQVWGVAARELLGPFKMGLVGLMLACLLAALMSSADCYMLIVSALIIRNGYAAYLHANASERVYVLAGRLVGIAVIVGGAVISLSQYNVFDQLKVVWEMPILFAAPFWVGMYWRRATPAAAWLTMLMTLVLFFILPLALPQMMPSLAEDQRLTAANDQITTITTRAVAPADVAKREGEIALWKKRVRQLIIKEGPKAEADVLRQFGPCPEPRVLGRTMTDTHITGGRPIYWSGPLEPIGEKIYFKQIGPPETAKQAGDHGREVIRRQYDCPMRGTGSFQPDFLLYDLAGVPLTKLSNAWIETLRLPTRAVLPFLIMIVLSLITPRARKEALDRYYVKMKTPVDPDPVIDQQQLELSYKNPTRFDHRRLLPLFGLEFQKPRLIDVAGFVGSFVVCFLLIWLVVWVAALGS
ncbi:MAG: sodium:solute symporter family protein [Pirellulales bacterium]|nr:sodium:solute symporter family protein [Pirellulales bacterium]